MVYDYVFWLLSWASMSCRWSWWWGGCFMWLTGLHPQLSVIKTSRRNIKIPLLICSCLRSFLSSPFAWSLTWSSSVGLHWSLYQMNEHCQIQLGLQILPITTQWKSIHNQALEIRNIHCRWWTFPQVIPSLPQYVTNLAKCLQCCVWCCGLSPSARSKPQAHNLLFACCQLLEPFMHTHFGAEFVFLKMQVIFCEFLKLICGNIIKDNKNNGKK